MVDTRTARLTRALAVVAALLAWTAAGIYYSRTGEVRWSLIAAGVAFAALSFAAGRGRTPPRS